MYRIGYFSIGTGDWESIKYIICGPLFLYVGVAYAPVWIVSAFFLVYLMVKFITTVIRVLYRASTRKDEEPRVMSKEELIEILSKNKDTHV